MARGLWRGAWRDELRRHILLDFPKSRYIIIHNNLFPIGQFYLRTFEPLTEPKAESFLEAAAAEIRRKLNSNLDDDFWADRNPAFLRFQTKSQTKAHMTK